MTDTTLEKSLNNYWVVATSIIMGLALILMFLLLPLLVGAVAEHIDITDQQLGWLASADLVGFFVAATAFVFFARKINWRWTAAGLLAALIALNFLSITYKDQIGTFLLLRFLNGLTQGGLAGIFAAHISDTLFPERYYGLYFAGQTILAAFFLYLLPPYIADMASPAPVIHAQSLTALLALIMVVLFMPQRGKDRSQEIVTANTAGFILPLIGIIGLLTFFIAQGGTWAYVERIGNAFGLEATFVGKALSISMAGSFIGAMMATIIDVKWGRALPLIITLIGQLVCLWCLFNYGHRNTPFLLSITLFSTFWAFANPYLFGTLIVVDSSGRTILFANPIFALGIALAPIILSFFISSEDYSSVGYLSALMITISMGLFLWVVKR